MKTVLEKALGFDVSFISDEFYTEVCSLRTLVCFIE